MHEATGNGQLGARSRVAKEWGILAGFRGLKTGKNAENEGFWPFS